MKKVRLYLRKFNYSFIAIMKFKVLLIPIFSFSIAAYAIFSLAETFNDIFMATNFSSKLQQKLIFQESLLKNLDLYAMVILLTFVILVMLSLKLTSSILSPFNKIKKFTYQLLDNRSDDPVYEYGDSKFIAKKSAKILFDFISAIKVTGTRNVNLNISQELTSITKQSGIFPYKRKVLFLIAIMMTITTSILFLLIHHFYNDIISIANPQIQKSMFFIEYLKSQEQFIDTIKATSLGVNALLYIIVAISCIRYFDRASLQFTQQAIEIVNPDCDREFFSKFMFLGKKTTLVLNELLTVAYAVAASPQQTEPEPEMEPEIVPRTEPEIDPVIVPDVEPEIKPEIDAENSIQEDEGENKDEEELPPPLPF